MKLTDRELICNSFEAESVIRSELRGDAVVVGGKRAIQAVKTCFGSGILDNASVYICSRMPTERDLSKVTRLAGAANTLIAVGGGSAADLTGAAAKMIKCEYLVLCTALSSDSVGANTSVIYSDTSEYFQIIYPRPGPPRKIVCHPSILSLCPKKINAAGLLGSMPLIDFGPHGAINKFYEFLFSGLPQSLEKVFDFSADYWKALADIVFRDTPILLDKNGMTWAHAISIRARRNNPKLAEQYLPGEITCAAWVNCCRVKGNKLFKKVEFIYRYFGIDLGLILYEIHRALNK